MNSSSVELASAFETIAAVGDFDFLVLSQTWQPFFCSTMSNMPGCASPTDYMKTQFTIHGLWPDKLNNNHPAFCSNVDLSDDDVDAAGRDDVTKYWPDVKNGEGSTQFAQNEWSKHGTCSGLSGRDYLRQALDLHIKIGTNEIISNNVGGQVSSNDVRTAYGTNMASLVCKGGALSELRTCYDKTYAQIVCPLNVLKQDNCGRNKQISVYSFDN